MWDKHQRIAAGKTISNARDYVGKFNLDTTLLVVKWVACSTDPLKLNRLQSFTPGGVTYAEHVEGKHLDKEWSSCPPGQG